MSGSTGDSSWVPVSRVRGWRCPRWLVWSLLAVLSAGSGWVRNEVLEGVCDVGMCARVMGCVSVVGGGVGTGVDAGVDRGIR